MDIFYVIRNNSNHYKLGITNRDANTRLKEFETGNSEELFIVKTFFTKHGRTFESTMHRRFKHKHLKGEWFELDEKDLNTLDDILSETEKNLDIVAEILKNRV